MAEKIIDPLLEKQWETFQQENPTPYEHIDTNELKERLITELGYVSGMTVEEYTLYQKWCEVKNKYPAQTVNTLFGEESQLVDLSKDKLLTHVKNNIWSPQDPMDFEKLQPELIYTKDSPELPQLWNAIRTFASTMKNNNNIGRNLNFIVRDKPTKKYLGVICISSDFLDLTPRDSYIGWDRERKTKKMINHTAIGSTIVPLQPLGYNYTGGKLLALMCLSDKVQETWKKEYGDTMVGVTTTSLYGSFSQYQNLRHWKKRGHSAGSVSYEATKPTIQMLRKWIMENHTRKYFEWYSATKPTGQPYKRDHRNRSHTFAYSKLGIPKELTKSDHSRGIYFSTLYDNTREFLREEIPEDKLVKSFESSVDALSELWRERYARKRIKSLIDQTRTNMETLYYDDLIHLTWEETKEKYLKQVGR
jgi:hypothetical protein|tara:strand:- start:2633 stop:3889 length:1257 start_codon:yes stop_codon:yes gene_type:complete